SFSSCDIQSEEIPPIKGDRESLFEMISNLLENAAKYTSDNGKIVVSLEAHNNHVTLIVDDNGPGIPENLHQKVFEKYYRIDDRLSSSVSGTGLGLTLVKNVVDAHKATIRIETSPLGGARFLIEFGVHYE
ncbi:MAG: ATP-binding protein, partial [Candidatus Altiarchaeota archaeon]